MTIDFHATYCGFVHHGWLPKISRTEWSNQHAVVGRDHLITFWRFAVGFDFSWEKTPC